MPLTFRKRFKVLPGTYVNVGKRGVSVTRKVGPVTMTDRPGRKTRLTVNLPGPVVYTTGGEVRRSPARKPTKLKWSEPKPGRIVRPDMPSGGFDPHS